MRPMLIALCLVLGLVLVATVASPQENKGGIFGLVSDRGAHLVASAPIEARNVDTGAKFAVNSGSMGLYRLTGLPAGTYDLSISIVGTPDFVQRVTVTAEKSLRLDIILPLG